jgi:putative hemolysin
MPDLKPTFAQAQPGAASFEPTKEVEKVWNRFPGAEAFRCLLRRLQSKPGEDFLERLLAELDIRMEVDPADLARVPRTGPVVVVSNHPFGMLEGAVLGTLLSRIRPDVKIVANGLLAGVPGLDGRCLYVNPFGERRARMSNSRALRTGAKWLKAGGMLVVFPAGEVSHWQFRRAAVTDPAWSESIARLLRLTGAATLPVFFKGMNSLPFHLLGLLHPRLRTMQLPQELLKQFGRTVELRIGTVITPKSLADIPSDRDVIYYLRWRTYLLANRGEPSRRLVPRLPAVKLPPRTRPPVVAETPREALIEELGSLRPDQYVVESSEYYTCVTTLQQTPNIVREIGRLREIAFRQAGEGSGKELDLDLYDSYYQHLFLWNKVRQEIVGAYRLVRVDHVHRQLGADALYSASLFRFDEEFFRRIGPAFELGRSFVRPEYQRQYAPLLGLWKGVTKLVSRNPEAPVLFGAVSISDTYHPVSRRLMASFLKFHEAHRELARFVRSRRRVPGAPHPHSEDEMMARVFEDLDSLGGPIGDIEADGKGVPVLVRQYLRMGGKLLGLTVDPSFSNTLDALILVDLRLTQRNMLERYMSKTEAASFVAYHQLSEMVSKRIAS